MKTDDGLSSELKNLITLKKKKVSFLKHKDISGNKNINFHCVQKLHIGKKNQNKNKQKNPQTGFFYVKNYF